MVAVVTHRRKTFGILVPEHVAHLALLLVRARRMAQPQGGDRLHPAIDRGL